jgi:hypothetical protein
MLEQGIKELICEREDCRARKDYKRADEIRATLADMGIILEDSKKGLCVTDNRPEPPKYSSVALEIAVGYYNDDKLKELACEYLDRITRCPMIGSNPLEYCLAKGARGLFGEGKFWLTLQVMMCRKEHENAEYALHYISEDIDEILIDRLDNVLKQAVLERIEYESSNTTD